MAKLAVVVTLALASSALAARTDSVQISELSGDTTQAQVIIDAPPSEVYALCTDYAHWPGVLSDVRSTKIEWGSRDRAKVHIQSRAFGRQITVIFDNVPDQSISFQGAPPPSGKRSSMAARGHYVLTPIDGGKRTQVTATLYVDVKGAASLFVRDSKIRRARQEKLRADWADIAKHFAQAS